MNLMFMTIDLGYYDSVIIRLGLMSSKPTLIILKWMKLTFYIVYTYI